MLDAYFKDWMAWPCNEIPFKQKDEWDRYKTCWLILHRIFYCSAALCGFLDSWEIFERLVHYLCEAVWNIHLFKWEEDFGFKPKAPFAI